MLPRRTIEVRAVDATDVDFLWLMLTYAASMEPGGEASVAEAMADPYLRTYVEGWGRTGDLGVIAQEPSGVTVGAAWLRQGLRHAEPDAPELATAVIPGSRASGVGTLMMTELCRRASQSCRAILLSVRAANPARRFYERLGFANERTVQNRVGGVSFVMRLWLT